MESAKIAAALHAAQVEVLDEMLELIDGYEAYSLEQYKEMLRDYVTERRRHWPGSVLLQLAAILAGDDDQ